ncbi:MAG: ABC transporter ATP-binding protein [Bacteroidales bacterium]|nr:ABC transporter ATP-binding protein [Bacteroidales bacterium]
MFIEAKSVTKYYSKFKAVDNLSFTVEEGDIYGFLGPNGSGKSTTIRMILSLITPTSGEIKLFGKTITSGKNLTLNRIGALVEKPDFYNYLTARKNLEILGKLSGVSELNKRIDEVLDIVGLSERAHSRVHTFSQGMKQKLGIAQTILHEPDLIILDEPTNGLDPKGQKEIRDMILELKQEKNITILISSHLLHEIEMIASRMIIINKGRAIIEGNVHELLKESEQQVILTVDNPEETLRMINESQWKNSLDRKDREKFFIKITRENIPILATYLAQKGALISSIEPIRSLEDYFLQATSHETTN